MLILESFGGDIAPWDVITPAFKREWVRQLQSLVELHETALETTREHEPKAKLAFIEYSRGLYLRGQPGLVVPVGAASAQFRWRLHGTPIPARTVVIEALFCAAEVLCWPL